MAEIGIFLYAMLTAFVLLSMERNQRLGQPSSEALTLAGWGLFSLSSTLALLMSGLAVALVLGFPLSLG